MVTLWRAEETALLVFGRVEYDLAEQYLSEVLVDLRHTVQA